MSQHWDNRYSDSQYAYGEDPNVFFKEILDNLKPGRILCPAEGEGRNAVYAATQGWSVAAFDQSVEGQKKALKLAEKQGVDITYVTDDIYQLPFDANEFDAMAFIYAHFPASVKSQFNQFLIKYLKPGGILIFEAFSKGHLEYVTRNPAIGGPKDFETLYSLEEIKADFQGFEIIRLEEVEIELKEGLYHNGIGKVIRFIGVKQ